MTVNVGTAFLDIRGDFSQFNAQLDSELGSTNSKFGKFGKAAAAGIAAAGVAAVAVGKQLYNIGESFDDASDTIRVATGKTGKALAGLEKDFKAVVKSTPTDFGSASKAVGELNQRLGLTGKPLQKMSRQVLELSRLTETDLSQNIKSTTRVFGDWGIKTNDQSAALDKLFRASQATGVPVAKLADSIVQFGAPLRQLGFSFEQSTAMIGKFEKEGVNTNLVMGSMRQALGRLAQAGKDPQEEFARTTAAIKAAGSEGEANALALKLFGARAGPDMAAAIREGRFAIDGLATSIKNGQGTILGAGKDTEDFAEKWQRFKNWLMIELEPVATSVFGAIGSAMDKLPGIAASVIATVRPIIMPIFEVASAFLHSKTAMAAAAAAAAVVVVAFGGLMLASAAAQAVQGLEAALRFLRAPLETTNALLRRNPFGAATAAVAALASAFVTAYRESASFRKAVNDAVVVVQDVAQRAWVAARNVGAAIVRGVLDGASELYGALKGLLESTLFKVLTSLNPFSPVEHGGELYIGRPLGEGAIKGWVYGSKELPAKLTDTVRASVEAARQKIESLRGTFKEAWSTLATEALAAFDGVMAQHQTPTETLLSEEDAKRAAQQLADNVASAQQALTEAQAGGDPKEIAQAQKQLDDAQWAQKRAGLEKIAKEERKQLDADNDLRRKHFQEQLDALGESLSAEGATQSEAHKRIQKLLRSFGVDYNSVGSALGKSFVVGLKETQGGAEKAAAGIAAVAKDRLTRVPTAADSAGASAGAGAGKGAGAGGGFGGTGPADLTDLTGGDPTKPVKDKLEKVVKDVKEKASEAVKAITGVFESVKRAFRDAWPTISAFADGVVQAWTTIRRLAEEIWSRYGAILVGYVKGMFDGISRMLSGFTDVLIGVANFVSGVFSGDWALAWDGIKQIFSGVWQIIEGLVVSGWTTLKTVFLLGVEAVKLIVSTAWDFITGMFKVSLGLIEAAVSGSWNWIKTKAGELWGDIKDGITSKVRDLREWLSSAWGSMRDRASEVWDSIKNRASDAWNSVKSRITNAVSDVRNALSDAWGAIRDRATEVWDSIKSKASSAWSSITGAISGVFSGEDGLKAKLSGFWGDIRETAEKGWNKIKDAVGTIADKISGAVTAPLKAAGSAVFKLVDGIISVINRIPGVEIKIGENPFADGKGQRNSLAMAPSGDVPGFAQGGVTHHDAVKRGARITRPMLIVGEEAPIHDEYTIPTNPAYRGRALGLFSELGNRLGVPGFAAGGVFGQAMSLVSGAMKGGVKGLLGKLPGIGDLPEWLSGAGKFALGKATSWITDKVKSIFEGKAGKVAKIIEFMNGVDAKNWPYVYGGGHGSFAGPYDCSGLVSAALNAAGLLGSGSPQTTDYFKGFGQAGDGEIITVGVRGSTGRNAHTMMKVGNKYLESGSGHGAQWVNGWSGNFPIHRHPGGFAQGGVLNEEFRKIIDAQFFDPSSPAFAGWGLAQGGTYPFVGSYKNGGVIPADGMALVHKNETVTPAGFNPVPEVHVFIGDRELADIVRVEVVERERTKAGAAMAGVRP